MSTLACAVPAKSFVTFGYPPVKPTAADLAKEAQTTQILAAAPFGRAPKGQAITRTQYEVAMRAAQARASAIDLRWPFWVGLGAGALGFVVLLAKR